MGRFNRSVTVAALTLLVWLSASSLCLAVPLRGPAAIDLSEDGRWAVIACRKDNSVAIVDLAQGPPYAVTNLDPDDGIGRRPVAVRVVGATAIVVNEYDTRLSLIDLATLTVAGHVDVPLYAQDVVWDPARSRFYVSNLWLERVFVFDAGWNALPPATGIVVGGQPGPMALGPDGRLYVGNRGTWDVSVVDPDSGVEDARIFLGSRPESLAATADAILVTNHGGESLQRVNGVPMIANDQVDIENVVTEIDPVTLGTTRSFVDQGADYAGIDVRAGLIVFSGAGSGTVHVHDLSGPADNLQTVDLLRSDALPGGRVGNLRVFTNTRDVIARLPDQVFAINHLRDTLVELRRQVDTFTVFSETPLNAVGEPIQAFQGAQAVNFLPVQNGERYLNTLSAWARDQRDFTCSTCHSDGHSDFRMILDERNDPFNPAQQQGPERHPSMRITASTAPYGWEGNQPTLLDFNAAALDRHDVPPSNPAEVFLDVAGFMEDFAKTLRPGPVPYGPNGEPGRALFNGPAACATCHVPPHFTDNVFHDVGTGRTINTPTLISLWDRPTYLHDGRAATIEQVLDPSIYEPGSTHGDLAELTPPQRQALADYLRTIGPDTCIEVVGPDIATDLRVSKGPCPPHVVRQPELDYLRTTLADLQDDPGQVVLGDAECLHDDRPRTNLEVTADATTAEQKLWIFLVRESNGAADYGQSSTGKPRIAPAGDCPE